MAKKKSMVLLLIITLICVITCALIFAGVINPTIENKMKHDISFRNIQKMDITENIDDRTYVFTENKSGSSYKCEFADKTNNIVYAIACDNNDVAIEVTLPGSKKDLTDAQKKEYDGLAEAIIDSLSNHVLTKNGTISISMKYEDAEFTVNAKQPEDHNMNPKQPIRQLLIGLQ